MSTTLYVVRHGQAQRGGSDPGLSEQGREQARRLGARLRGFPIGEVRHSPKRRAAETARELGLDVPLTVEPLLDDRTPVPSPGRWADYPAELRGFLADVPAAHRDEDAETLRTAVTTLSADDGTDRHVVLVSHLFVVGWFVRDALRAPEPAWAAVNASNTGLTIVRYRTGAEPEVLAVDDTGHLEAEAHQ